MPDPDAKFLPYVTNKSEKNAGTFKYFQNQPRVYKTYQSW